MSIVAALRIDICCGRAAGAALGPMIELLERHTLRATWCVATGPDRSGRALVNILREPGFLARQLRMKAPRVYGIRTLLAGTLLPATELLTPVLGAALRRLVQRGHEVALHGHDHRSWQNRIESWSQERTEHDLQASRAALRAAGLEPRGSAAPAWRATPASIAAQVPLGLHWAGDLRAGAPLRLVDSSGAALGPPQIPVNLPTCDELLAWPSLAPVGRVPALAAALRPMLSAQRPPPLVYAAHPEVDALVDPAPLAHFVRAVRAAGGRFATLGEIAAELDEDLPRRALARARCRGRGGWVASDGGALPWLEPLGA